MDTLILNAGHSQLEEQLKIAAKCGLEEQQNKDEAMDNENGEELGVIVSSASENSWPPEKEDSSKSSSENDSTAGSPNSSSDRRGLEKEFVETLEQFSKQGVHVLAGQALPNLGEQFRSELKRPDLKGTFRCSICSKIFCHSSSLSRHRMQAHFKSYTCTICRKQITRHQLKLTTIVHPWLPSHSSIEVILPPIPE